MTKMTAEEFERAARRLVGVAETGKAHGWQTKAHEALGVSRQALGVALKDGPSKNMVERLDALLSGVKDMEAGEDFGAQAGMWFVGEPESRKRATEVLGEVVVTHLGFPRFFLYAERVRGKDDVRFTARWLDEPSTRERKLKLLDRAKDKALTRLHDSAKATAERQTSERMQRAARAACGLAQADLEVMSAAGLQVSRYAADPEGLARAYRAVGEEAADLLEKTRDMSPAELRAFRLGLAAGKLQQQEKVYSVAWAHAGADVMQSIAAQPYKYLPLAHKETTRGKTQEELEAEKDFREMGELEWGDEDEELSEEETAVLEAYSRGEMSERQACDAGGYRDGAELLLALAQAGLTFPRPPHDISEAQADVFVSVLRGFER
jgi:hypothetical protein